jgi:hypothetical protein
LRKGFRWRGELVGIVKLREVARLHLDALGTRLTELTKKQADGLGVDADGPYKAAHYRY